MIRGDRREQLQQHRAHFCVQRLSRERVREFLKIIRGPPMFMHLCWIIVAPQPPTAAARFGFTNVYADLRFVLSAGTHCPGIIIPPSFLPVSFSLSLSRTRSPSLYAAAATAVAAAFVAVAALSPPERERAFVRPRAELASAYCYIG